MADNFIIERIAVLPDQKKIARSHSKYFDLNNGSFFSFVHKELDCHLKNIPRITKITKRKFKMADSITKLDSPEKTLEVFSRREESLSQRIKKRQPQL